jgi:hypothetical protein
MGMRVGGNNASWASQGAGVNNWQQRQQGMKDLMSTLASGDLAGAQKAYASIAGNKGQIDSNSPLGKIGAALQNNDLAGAEKNSPSHAGQPQYSGCQSASQHPEQPDVIGAEHDPRPRWSGESDGLNGPSLLSHSKPASCGFFYAPSPRPCVRSVSLCHFRGHLLPLSGQLLPSAVSLKRQGRGAVH